ncbi:hypothetical protein JZ751_011729 [Albula glossodonta]|uniref:Uncharacterized protein n=1 Tax=Albula glossodonta TaxID=121402 RepID=A0A8T2PQL2_9TELE|nr:hypothetical protein JZ751_011729 [Albula glossodonta]
MCHRCAICCVEKEGANSYQESVLRPRQESKLRQREERFYRMTGESWKLTQGQPLGAGASTFIHCSPQDLELSALLYSLTRLPAPVFPLYFSFRKFQFHPIAGRLWVWASLQEGESPEPQSQDEEGGSDTPNQQAVRRRKLPESATRAPPQPDRPVEKRVLLDWLLKTGYHPAIYTVCTSYPRRPLDTGRDLTLADVGIKMDTVLNVEEKDPSLT